MFRIILFLKIITVIQKLQALKSFLNTKILKCLILQKKVQSKAKVLRHF